MSKHYTQADILKHINWVEHKQMQAFLETNGITPAHVIDAGNRKFRLFDQRAYDKACELRRQRDAERGLTKVKQQSSPPPVDLQVMSEIAALRGEMRALHTKLDRLLNELGGIQFVDEQHVNGAALTA